MRSSDPSRLPDYTVRRHPRAKSARLRVTVRDGLVVIAPKRLSRRSIEEFVRSQKTWIESAIQQTSEQKKSLLEDKVYLRAIDQRWTVAYSHVEGPRPSLREQYDRLIVTANLDDPVAVADLLGMWLTSTGKQYLLPMLHNVSREMNMPFSRLTVRSQKTRWGSCSGTGNISLNRALLFFPPRLIKYVLIHELCHTRHMDHSDRYWALVERHEPDHRHLARELRQEWKRYVPEWAVV